MSWSLENRQSRLQSWIVLTSSDGVCGMVDAGELDLTAGGGNSLYNQPCAELIDA